MRILRLSFLVSLLALSLVASACGDPDANNSTNNQPARRR